MESFFILTCLLKYIKVENLKKTACMSFWWLYLTIITVYTLQQKKRENLHVTFKLIEIKYVEFKKCMKYILHVKLSIYSIQLVLHVIYISWIQHILFSISLRGPIFRVTFTVEYILSLSGKNRNAQEWWGFQSLSTSNVFLVEPVKFYIKRYYHSFQLWKILRHKERQTWKTNAGCLNLLTSEMYCDVRWWCSTIKWTLLSWPTSVICNQGPRL